MAPAVAPGAQVRRAAAAVRAQRRRHLGDAQAVQRRLDDHLAGELHAGGAQAKRQDGSRGRSRAGRSGSRRPAMPKKQPADAREHRVADVAVQRTASRRARCRPGSGCPSRARCPARSSSTKRVERREVVAVVGVAHDDVAAARGARCRRAGRCRTRARRRRRPARRPPRRSACEPSVLPLSATTTSPSMPRPREVAARLGDARRQRLGLVEAGHEDRQFTSLEFDVVSVSHVGAALGSGTSAVVGRGRQNRC